MLTHLPLCRIYASVNWVIIDSGNGLSPGRRQAITWTNAGLLSIGPVRTNFSEIWINSLENVVCQNGGHFVQGGDELIDLWIVKWHLIILNPMTGIFATVFLKEDLTLTLWRLLVPQRFGWSHVCFCNALCFRDRKPPSRTMLNNPKWTPEIKFEYIFSCHVYARPIWDQQSYLSQRVIR